MKFWPHAAKNPIPGWLVTLFIALAVAFALHEPPRPKARWEVRCARSHSFVNEHFDYTSGLTKPRYTVFCDEYALLWIGGPGINVMQTAPDDPVTFDDYDAGDPNNK